MIEVISTGPFACLQDLGRPGYRELGVSRSGAADLGAHRLANRLVGNAETAATIEFLSGGLEIRLTHAATVAFTGARGVGVPWQTALSVPSGTRLTVSPPAAGVRSYLAVRGGFCVPPVLGSRATDTLSGLGPPPLAAGQQLPIGGEARFDPSDDVVLRPPADRALRVVPGPRTDWFVDPGQLYAQDWSVRADSNRVGIRLDGPSLLRRRLEELPSEPTLPGAIQVPPDGQPIVLFRDAPVTGGYPVIGVVHSVDLDRLGQLRPGQRIRFGSAGLGSALG